MSNQHFMNYLMQSNANNESLPYFGGTTTTASDYGMMSETERIEYEINYHAKLLEKQHSLPKPKSEYSAFF